jgi:GH15 family glucan-1,4-alpha-glucosidase
VSDDERYPPIGAYGLISDCHSAALVSTRGSIDWWCPARFDAGSCFARLLDAGRGGSCRVAPTQGEVESFQSYVGETLVLETIFRTQGGEARVIDCLTMRPGGRDEPDRRLLRIVEGSRGEVDFDVLVAPRFDYGEITPHVRRLGGNLFGFIGGNDGLAVSADYPLWTEDGHVLAGSLSVRAGERGRLSLAYRDPALFDEAGPAPPTDEELDARLEDTLAWWRTWASRAELEGPEGPGTKRSAIVLKALTNAPTGAMVAAPTTSLPESPGGDRNWDYRFSWIRDSTFCARSLAELGYVAEADGFRRFIERSSAGLGTQLQVFYGVGGERRLIELELDLEGWRGARPVRIGNASAGQLQLDAFGQLVSLTWRWHRRGNSPDDDHWRFLLDVVDTAIDRWQERDSGIWEIRDNPQHFTHSKVMCWAAVNRALKLAEECMRKAPERRWRKARDEIRAAVEEHGYDHERGLFVRSFGSRELDAALLLLPTSEFLAWDDPRMLRTTDAIAEDLSEDGLLKRFREGVDELHGGEGAFVACTFWLAECYAEQRRPGKAHAAFERGVATANHLGLFSEEFSPRTGEMLGNFPQGLSHHSHILAAVALNRHRDLAARE